MIITQKITLDLAIRGITTRIAAKQGDANSRAIEITLLNNKQPWPVPEGTTAAVRYRKADGTAGLYDTLPDGTTPAVTCTGNVLTVNLAPQMLSYPKDVYADVLLTSGASLLATFDFIVEVARNPVSGSTLESQDYYKVVSLEQINAALASLGDSLESLTAGMQYAASIAADAAQTANAAVKSAAENASDTSALKAQVSQDAPGIIETAEGETITLADGSDRPLQGLVIYGRTTQTVTTGAQLYDVDDTYSVFANDNGWVTIDVDNTNGAGDAYVICATNPSELIVEGGTYLAVIEIKENTLSSISVASGTTSNYKGQFSTTFAMSYGNVGIFTKEVTARDNFDDCLTMLRSVITASAGQKGRLVFRISILKDLTITPGTFSYEPYTGGMPSPSPDCPQPLVSAGDNGSIGVSVTDGADDIQSLIIPTPNGLPGIPVDSGGNYTDADGQQWVCDEMDLARGVYVQCVGRIESYAGEAITTQYISTTGQLTDGATVLYVLPSLIENPIPEDVMAAYAALYTNKPDTTIYNDAGAHMEVRYVADTKLYIDKQINTLAAAIVNNT